MDSEDEKCQNFENDWEDRSEKKSNDPWQSNVKENCTIPCLKTLPTDPLRNMKSSELYVQALEKKLQRMKGLSASLKPTKMIKSLQTVRNQQASQLLYSDARLEDGSGSVGDDFETASIITSVQRKLNPEKQALNPVELIPLVQEDVLAKHVEIEHASDTESGEVT